MNFRRVLSLALAACVVSAVASCADDGGSPTSSDTNALPGSQARSNGTQLVLASGGGQTGVPGQPLPNPVAVRVLDATQRPVSGATVNFIARDGSANPTQASTDAEGYARTTWTLGAAAGPQELRVSGTGGTTLVVGATAAAAAKVVRVQVIPDSLVLSQGATGGFSAVAYDSTGNALAGRTVTWTSSDSVTATVGSTGTVTAVSPGAATVSATVEGVSGTARVIVTAPPPVRAARVKVEPDSVVLRPGQTGDFNAIAFDSAGNVLTGRGVSWTISDSTVARLSGEGGVTALSAGTAQVTATVEGVSGAARVVVVAPPPASVARVVVSPDSVVLEPGHGADLSAAAYDAEGHLLTGRGVSWASSDSAVAYVGADGGVTAVSAGTAQVTATVEGASGFARVIVVAPPPPAAVAHVAIIPDSLVLDVGGSADLDAVAYDAEGHVLTGRAVTWTTSDSTVATVGAGGTVTGVSPGSTQVRATVEGVSGAAAVRVREPARAAVARVDLTPDSLVLQPNQTEHFIATAYDADGHVLTGRAVTWSSSDSMVAVVGTGGAVTAVRPGRARISATVEGVSGSGIAFVYGLAIARLEVVPDSQVVVIGQTADFSAFAYDATNHVVSGLTIKWSISDPAVARIGQYGLVTALAAGTARVTATVQGLSGSATVRVIEQPVGNASAPANVSPDISAGYDYVCRLRSGIIRCFGSDGMGQPIGEHRAAAGSFVQLSAGQTHACGLRGDGVVECFGSNEYGEAPAQKRAATGSFTQVSAGLAHSCAVRSDGAMECWGNNQNGEAPAVVAPQSARFIVVTAFANRTCALRNDGAVECRGYRHGSPDVTVLPGGWYVKIGTSVGSTVCFERNSGLGECWGAQPNLGSGPFEELTAGASQECVLRPGGTAFCAGNASSFEGPGERSLTAAAPGSIRPPAWARIAAGSYHTCGLRADGYFECFGLQTIGSDAPDVVPSADAPRSALSGGSVRISWRDINSNELRTEIDRSVADAGGNPTTWARAGVLAANTTGFTDGLATPGGIYVYRIRVCNDAGCSGWAQSNATPYPAASPPVPGSVMASAPTRS